MDLGEKLKKVDREIQLGLKMKSANRLRTLINQYPNELILWEKLAELYFKGGFLDAAGKFWILCEPKNEEIKKCVEIYEKSVNYSGTQILNEIKFKGDIDKLPKYSKEKLLALQSDSKKKSGYFPTFTPKLNKTQINNLPETLSDKIIPFIMLAILIISMILAIIGFIAVTNWIF